MVAVYQSNVKERDVSTQYWTKIYTKFPFCIYFYGPFSSRETAGEMQEDYIKQLTAEGKTVVSCFQFHPSDQEPALDSCLMNHIHWLHELMQDYLKLQVTYMKKDVPTVLEHHSQLDSCIS